MKGRLLVLLLVAIPLGVHAEATRPGDELNPIRIRAGFQHVLRCVAVTRVSIGNPELVEARPLSGGNGVLVVGKKEGETDLVVWDRNGMVSRRVRVESSGIEAFDEAVAFLRHFPGARAELAGKTILVTGTVPAAEDKKVIETYAASHPGILSRVSTPEDTRKLLFYDLKILEISKGATSQIGLRLSDSLPVTGNWAGGAASLFTFDSQFEARLNLLMADGKARILANPRIVCESGATADFLAGGEIPIVLITTKTRTVEWKTYGIILKLAPLIKSDGTVSTKVTAEISTIDHGSGSSEIPAFLTRRITTAFSTPAGSTVMLSGLIKSESAKDVAKVPLLGQIPILGELFKSRSFRDNQTELAIFITPAEFSGESGDKPEAWDEKMRQSGESLQYRLID